MKVAALTGLHALSGVEITGSFAGEERPLGGRSL